MLRFSSSPRHRTKEARSWKTEVRSDVYEAPTFPFSQCLGLASLEVQRTFSVFSPQEICREVAVCWLEGHLPG